jgi:hypothetical protein
MSPSLIEPKVLVPPVLIVGYQRFDNIRKILRLCLEAKVSSIWIYIDGPKEVDLHTTRARSQFELQVRDMAHSSEFELHVHFCRKNSGAAVSVISGVSWALNSVDSIVVLEDDCIPSIDFFDFCRLSIPILDSSKDLWLACGSQFTPNYLINDESFVSRYALTWGWTTTRNKWEQISKSLGSAKNLLRLSLALSLSAEWSFWASGARRSLYGYTDVWDTLLLFLMRKERKYALLPDVPLVTNLGNDVHATHTRNDYRWTNVQTGRFTRPIGIGRNQLADAWLKEFFYEIRGRHLFSTRIRLLVDFFSRRRFHQGLLRRIEWALDQLPRA